MVAKWQQWMPFYIDAFMGSPAVQAMHPTARIGYLCLLARAWQTEDCTIPSDDETALSDMSGLGDELWTAHRDRILKKFELVPGSIRLRNDVLYEKWKEAKRIYDRRREAAERTNTERSPSHSPERKPSRTPIKIPTNTERSPSRFADTRTGTVTGTETRTGTGESTPPTIAPSVTVTVDDFDANPRENIPEGLALVQYGNFVLQELHVAAGHALVVKTGDAIAMLAQVEACGLPEATKRLLGRMEDAAASGPVKWLFWLEDGRWQERNQTEVSTEGMN